MRLHRSVMILIAPTLLMGTTVLDPVRWGGAGHEMAARAAVSALPADVPAFFRLAADQLVYLDPEPDRWRSGNRPEMRGAWAPDHFINLENLPDGALDAADRYAFMARLYRAGVDRPDQSGFLPFTIVELYQRLVTEWELWRRERDPARRAWIEQRIINDAGILGHFVTDGAQPHHTTIHYNGWADGAANPERFTQDRNFHARFETDFVAAHVEPRGVERLVERPRSVAGAARQAVMEYLDETHGLVEELYRIERDVGFDPSRGPGPEAVRFATERLAAGGHMLATLWVSAWVESG